MTDRPHVGTTWSGTSNHFTAGEPDPDRNNTFRALCRQNVRLYVEDVSDLPDHVRRLRMPRPRWCRDCMYARPRDPRVFAPGDRAAQAAAHTAYHDQAWTPHMEESRST